MQKTCHFLFFLIILSFMVACAGKPSDQSARAVEEYYQALVDRDQNRLINASCGAWESQARTDFNAFTAVKLELKDLKCNTTGEEGDAKLVSCSGFILANYGAEDLEVNIADRTYLVVKEGGEWRLCGIR